MATTTKDDALMKAADLTARQLQHPVAAEHFLIAATASASGSVPGAALS